MKKIEVAEKSVSQKSPAIQTLGFNFLDKITQAHEKFSVLDRVPMGVCVLQSDQVVLFWNGCLEEWTKIPRNKILGTQITEHFPHLNQPKYANRLQQIFQGGPPTIFSSQLHKHLIPSPLPHGKLRVQHTTVTPVAALDGTGYYALLSIQDVTDLTYQIQDYRNLRDQALAEVKERQRTEEALRSSIATNRALINAIPDLMFRISKDGTVVNFKAAKDNHLLVPFSECLGKNLYQVLPLEVADSTMGCVERALQTGEIQIFEYQLLVNNNLRDYEARIVVSAEDEIIAIVRDITKRKRAEADIRNALEKEKELSELKSRFVSMTSHEFRTPLTTILSSAELLESYSHKWTEKKKLEHLQRIQAAVKHMTQLLNDVLLIGKAEAGKLEFNPLPLDLAAFCHNLVEEMQLGTSSHIIDFRIQEQCINACMDEKLLRHILSNLLSNAIKYSPQGRTVHFALVSEQEEAIFYIQDEGIGIPTADQAQLFNSFHRASNVGTISGTGLGLAIVKKSVDLHSGKIAVTSEVGVGTKFTVTLPLNH